MIIVLVLVGLLVLGGILLVALSARRFTQIVRAGSTTAGIRSGRVHVTGRAASNLPLISPWSGQPAVWFKISIETYDGIRSGWGRIGSVTRSVPHALEGPRGRIWIEAAEAADVVVSKVRRARDRVNGRHPGFSDLVALCKLGQTGWERAKVRVIEERFSPGDELHAFGVAELRAGPPVPHAFRQAPSAELSMRPQILTDRSKGVLLASCAGMLALGVVMFVAGVVPVLALIRH